MLILHLGCVVVGAAGQQATARVPLDGIDLVHVSCIIKQSYQMIRSYQQAHIGITQVSTREPTRWHDRHHTTTSHRGMEWNGT